MPTAPSYGGAKIAPTPLPGARLTAVPSAETFGAAGGDAMRRAGAYVADVAQREAELEVQRANDATLLEERRVLNEWEDQALHHPQTGAVNRRGKEALAVKDELTAGFDAYVTERERGLNERLRLPFRKFALARREQLVGWAEKHAYREGHIYDQQAYDADLANSQDRAGARFDDPQVIATEIAFQRGRVEQHLRRLGAPDSMIDQKLLEVESSTHVRVIDRMVSTGKDQTALAYYTAVATRIDPSIASKVEGVLQSTVQARQQQAEADLKARNAQASSDLEIAVHRGKAGFTHIEKAYEAGIITPPKRVELTLHLDRKAKEGAERSTKAYEQIRLVEGALSGRGYLDFRQDKDRAAVDEHFKTVIAPNLQRLPPNEAADVITNYSDRIGIIPPTVKGYIRSSLRAGDTKSKVATADLLDRLKTKNPGIVEDFAADDIALGNAISTYVRAGMNPKKAVELAEQQRSVPQPEREARDQRYRHDKLSDKNLKHLREQVTGFRMFSTSLPDKVPDALAGEYETLTRAEFVRSGDIDIARKTALDQVRNVWGVTASDDGKPRWMKYAPEVVYNVPGETRPWIKQQLRSELKKNSLFDGEPELVLVADSLTARERHPSYVVLNKRSGVLEPLLGADGRPLRYRPDYASSDAGKERAKAALALEQQAAGVLMPGAEPPPALTPRSPRRRTLQ